MVKLKEVEEPTRLGNWLVFNVKEFTVTARVSLKPYQYREATITLETPNKVTRIALPLCDGSGPQPEDTITMIEMQDAIRNEIKMLEQVLSETTEEKSEKAW